MPLNTLILLRSICFIQEWLLLSILFYLHPLTQWLCLLHLVKVVDIGLSLRNSLCSHEAMDVFCRNWGTELFRFMICYWQFKTVGCSPEKCLTTDYRRAPEHGAHVPAPWRNLCKNHNLTYLQQQFHWSLNTWGWKQLCAWTTVSAHFLCHHLNTNNLMAKYWKLSKVVIEAEQEDLGERGVVCFYLFFC